MSPLTVLPYVMFIIPRVYVLNGMHMNSEKIDWISECGVEREHRIGFLGRVKASLLKRKSRKARDVNDLDPTELVERHNAVFGIDSREPTAAMRYDMRKDPEPTRVDVGPIEFTPSEPETGGTAYTTRTVPDPMAVPGALTSGAGAEPARTVYDSDAPLDPPAKEVPASPEDFFPEVPAKNDASEEAPETSPGTEEVREIPVCADESITQEAAEFEDARTEDIVQYVEEEIDNHETRQTSIDDPAFDEDIDFVTAEPVITRQERLDVEFEPPRYDGDVKSDLAAASAAAEAVVDAIITQSLSAPAEQAAIAAPAETAGIPAPAEVPALGAPLETPVLSAPASEVHHLEAPEQSAMIGAPASSVSYVRVREINAANVSAGRYGEAQAAVFESQIAEVEASQAQDSVKSVQMSQIIGGMLIASQISANRVMPAAEEAIETAEAEETPDVGGVFAFAREKNVSNAEAGMYSISVARNYECQISEIEASGVPADVARVQIAQLIGGMLIAAQTSANATPAPVVEDIPETVVADICPMFVSARDRNAANVSAGRYGEAQAAVFEAQISEIESSSAPADARTVQVAQLIGGMLLASQITANAVMPVAEAEPETVEAEEAIEAVPETVETAEADIGPMLASARDRNAANVSAGMYGEAQAAVFESQIDEIEASSVPAEVRTVQVAQVIGGMLLASQISANRVVPVAEEVPETVPEAEVSAAPAVEVVLDTPVAEPVPETIEVPAVGSVAEVPEAVAEAAVPVAEAPSEDVPAVQVPKSSGVSFRFGQTAYRSAVRGTVVRFVFGSASE